MSFSDSPLRRLGQIIADAIDTIESRLIDADVSYPSIDKPFDPSSPAENLLLEPELLTAGSHIIAAAAQLIATVRHPAQTIIDDGLSVNCFL